MKLADLAAQQIERLAAERQDNRARFPFAAEMLDTLKDGGIDARIVYAENAAGETVGKRDPGPWCEYLPQGVRAASAQAGLFAEVA